MQLPIAVRRAIYRLGYRVLTIFWVLRAPRLNGAKCVITDGERVLLVRHTYGRGWWDLPGGGMRAGEPAIEAARREMREELGIDVTDWTLIGEIGATIHRRSDTLHCFHVDLDAPALTLDLGELAAAWWFRRAELPYDMAPWVLPILAQTTVQHRQ
jgi:8-oxo-dGTP pyrophosphatase MutT (NUDIX family)